MSPTAVSVIETSEPTGKRGLKQLRSAAGYKNAREYAEHLGVPRPTYYRWEQHPLSMPVKAAWAIADDLGVSIDAVVDRPEPEASEQAKSLPESYRRLSPVSRALFDEYLIYLQYREGRR